MDTLKRSLLKIKMRRLQKKLPMPLGADNKGGKKGYMDAKSMWSMWIGESTRKSHGEFVR